MTVPVTEPFKPLPGVDTTAPQPARLQVIERHKGARFGNDRPLVPNAVRVNGVLLRCPTENPIMVKEIRVSGISAAPLVVVLRLQARAVALGAEPLSVPDPLGENRTSFSVIEIPQLGESDQHVLAAPYAVVNGMRLQLACEVIVDAPCKIVGEELLVVELPLVCRTLVFDDEPLKPASDGRALFLR